MAKKDFVFGVDLDGVVADFIGGLKPIAAEWLGIAESELTNDVSYGFREWKLGRAGGYDDLHRYALKEKGLFETLPVMEGAAASLRRLSSKGIRIRIITHRLYIPWFHRQAVNQTIEWLERKGIPFWDLCFMKAKSSVDADIYVEDSPGNIKLLRADGRKVIVMRNSTNKSIKGFVAKNWDDVERLVLQEWKRSLGRRN